MLVFLFLTTFCLSVESCDELKMLSPVEDTVIAIVNYWVHLTLELNAENCANQIFVITVERREQWENSSLGLICRFILNGTSCELSEKMRPDRCRYKTWADRANFSTRLEEPGHQVYRWRWFGTQSGKDDEKQINVYVAAAVVTKSDHTLNYIMAGVCGFLLVMVFLVIIFARWRKTAASTPVASENCQHVAADGCFTHAEDLYSRLDYYRQTPSGNQRAARKPVEMFINFLYERISLRRVQSS